MSVKIRLARTGKKKSPSYRVVIADERSPRDGRVIETVGTYDPTKEPTAINLKQERVSYWLKQGALPTQTVAKIIEKAPKSVLEPSKDEKAEA